MTTEMTTAMNTEMTTAMTAAMTTAMTAARAAKEFLMNQVSAIFQPHHPRQAERALHVVPLPEQGHIYV